MLELEMAADSLLGKILDRWAVDWELLAAVA